jgi:hypothetical protein
MIHEQKPDAKSAVSGSWMAQLERLGRVLGQAQGRRLAPRWEAPP